MRFPPLIQIHTSRYLYSKDRLWAGSWGIQHNSPLAVRLAVNLTQGFDSQSNAQNIQKMRPSFTVWMKLNGQGQITTCLLIAYAAEQWVPSCYAFHNPTHCLLQPEHSAAPLKGSELFPGDSSTNQYIQLGYTKGYVRMSLYLPSHTWSSEPLGWFQSMLQKTP